jgi:hypothetical protein
MILFVTGQYAGAQYIAPLIKRWKNDNQDFPEYKIVAISSSIKYWKQNCINFDNPKGENIRFVESYLEKTKPSLIVLSASAVEEVEYIFILQAKQLGIRTINFIDTWTNYKNRYIYKGKEVYPDIILSIDDKCTEEMIRAGIPANLIKEVGQPYLEEVCKKIPPLGSKILLPIQPIKKSNGNSFGYDEEDFLKLSLDAIKRTGKINQVYITTHPDSNVIAFDKEVVKYGAGNGVYDIKNAYIVLGMYSTQMIIGYLWGRKVASIQPGLRANDPSPLSRWGLVPRIKNSNQLYDFIQEAENNNSGRDKILDNIFGSLERFDKICRQ